MTQVHIEKKWIEARKTSFKESVDETTGKKKLYLDVLVLPWSEISRNGVLYNKEKASTTSDQIIGKYLMHNHVTDGATTLPRGEWIEKYTDEEGLHAKAEIYQTKYNEDYIDFLKSAKNIRVSLQVTGDAKQRKTESGDYYQEAFIDEWLEISTVNIPGFNKAAGSFMVAMSEAFKGIIDEDKKKQREFYEKLGMK